MSHLVPCPGCNRHVRNSEASCPFCDRELDLARSPAPAVPTTRIGRAALFTFSATLAGATALAACGGESESNDDGGGGKSGSANGGSSKGGSSTGGDTMTGGFGGMLSLRLAAGEGAAKAFTAGLRVFKRATSLGSGESLAEHRASVEGPGTLCPADLVRLSVGIEHLDDLVEDIRQALAGVSSKA